MSTANVYSAESLASAAAAGDFRTVRNLLLRRNDDEITATEAMLELGTYRTYFYELVNAGLVKRHWRKSTQKRAFYLRSEIRELKARLDAEGETETDAAAG